MIQKLGGLAKATQSCATLWKDPDRLESWAEKNNLKFSKGKHRVLHPRRSNPLHQYSPGAGLMGSSSAEKDLGVLVDNKLFMSQKCATVAKQANRILEYRSRELILPSASPS